VRICVKYESIHINIYHTLQSAAAISDYSLFYSLYTQREREQEVRERSQGERSLLKVKTG